MPTPGIQEVAVGPEPLTSGVKQPRSWTMAELLAVKPDDAAPPVAFSPLVIVSPYSQSRRPSVRSTLLVRSAAVHFGPRSASMAAPIPATGGAGFVQPAAPARGTGPMAADMTEIAPASTDARDRHDGRTLRSAERPGHDHQPGTWPV